MRLFSTLPGLLLFLFVWPSSSSANQHGLGARVDPAEMRAGGLLLETVEGLREAPSLATDVEITVTGLIARTRVTQRFSNPTADWVEGVYVFPLPEDSAVDSLRMRIGERVIEGRVEERARAKATYRKAKSEGRKASLVEQERPNLFTTSIANLGPAESVEVVLTYQEDVRYDEGRFSLRFPMVVAPRFIPRATTPEAILPLPTGVEEFSETGWSMNTQAVADAARISPPVSNPEAPRSHPVTLRVEIDAGFPLEDIESASHPVRVRAAPDHLYHVVLDGGRTPANADFLLDWRPVVGAAPRAALFTEARDGEQYALLMVLPPAPEEASQARVSRETIIVIDTSGSMGGESIVQARRAVDFALGTLRPEDAFNVIRFDSTTRGLFDGSRPAASESVEAARRWVERLNADGGTDMLPAIEAALTPGRESRAVRQVIFVTDGAVGNESELFAMIQRLLGASRLFTVGIGSAPNSHFMSKAAELGRGTFTYISRPEEVADKMGTLFSKLESPVLHDLRIDWGTGSGARNAKNGAVEAWPNRIPDVYLGEPVVVAARLPEGVSEALLRGRRGRREFTMRLPLEGGSKHEGVSRLWARRKIAALMDSLHEGQSIDRVSSLVAELGVKHQLVTRWSSLVAVDVTPTAPVGVSPDTRHVPSLLPRGWDFFKLFGLGDSQTAPPQQPEAGNDPGRDTQRTVAAGRTPEASPVSIRQPLAHVQVGRLPQGATPSALLLLLGMLLTGSAGIASRVLRREPLGNASCGKETHPRMRDDLL